MTIYRIDEGKAAEAFMDTVDGFPIAVKVLIQQGVLVEVEPVDARIMCDECDGTGTRQGFIGSSGCSVCDERGFIIAPVVVVEDTE